MNVYRVGILDLIPGGGDRLRTAVDVNADTERTAQRLAAEHLGGPGWAEPTPLAPITARELGPVPDGTAEAGVVPGTLRFGEEPRDRWEPAARLLCSAAGGEWRGQASGERSGWRNLARRVAALAPPD